MVSPFLECFFFHLQTKIDLNTKEHSLFSSPDGTGDVLNDIGNMLANLTDELDAMLEQEVTLKN